VAAAAFLSAAAIFAQNSSQYPKIYINFFMYFPSICDIMAVRR
jgi:hypothetical protein